MALAVKVVIANKMPMMMNIETFNMLFSFCEFEWFLSGSHNYPIQFGVVIEPL
jgi:hypothetical protein